MTRPPRLHPLPLDAMTPATRAVVEPTIQAWGHPLNIFATLARHPDLLKPWLRFGQQLLGAGTLPARDRELVILRTSWNCGAAYEWGHHVGIGKAAGLDDAAIARVPDGPDAPAWDPFEAALLRAVDECHAGSAIGDATWATLAARYDERQLIELPMLIGQYTMLAFALNSLAVAPDPGSAPFPVRPRP